MKVLRGNQIRIGFVAPEVVVIVREEFLEKD
ncbi:MAG: carbon storage regulator [Proteobacteria bacterium]|nr:carbon storage regulator [Pseudomonadota bacterium]